MWGLLPRSAREVKHDLASYARELFGEPFDDESVIGESLLTTDEFLKGCLVTRFQTPGTADLGTMDPLAYESVQDYVRAQSTLWMGSDLSQKPVMLAEALKQHAFFRNLLTILGNRAVAAGDLAAELKKQLPGFGELDDAYLDRLLGSFLALVSRARILGPVIDEKQKYDPLVQIGCNSGCESFGEWWRRSEGRPPLVSPTISSRMS